MPTTLGRRRLHWAETALMIRCLVCTSPISRSGLLSMNAANNLVLGMKALILHLK